MASFEDASVMNDNVPNRDNHLFLPELKDHDTVSPVLPKEVPVSDEDPSSSRQKLPYVCDICSKAFSRKDVLNRHKKFLHLKEKPFSCDVCQKCFVQKSDLLRHWRIHARDTSSSRQKLALVCDICSKAFSRKDVLIRHKKFLHLKEKPFSCDVCQKYFVQKSDLQRHWRVHSNPKIIYNCDKCNEVFSRKCDLQKHRMNHKAHKQYNCEKCNEVFSKKYDLRKHGMNHKSPKQYNCEKCDDVFSRKFDLSKHMKIHKCSKQHKCIHCNEVFNRKTDLLYHVNTLHNVLTKSIKSSSSSLKEELYEKVKHFKRQNALGIFTKTVINSNEENDKDFYTFFNSIRSDVLNELNYQMLEKGRMKWYATAHVIVTQITQEDDLQTATPYFHSKTILQLTTDNLSTNLEDAFAKINNSFEKFTQRGSGWTLEKILYLELSTAKYGMT